MGSAGSDATGSTGGSAAGPQRYRLLLAALLLLFLLIPLTGDQGLGNWVVIIAFVAMLLASLRAVGLGSRLLLPMSLLAVLTIVPFPVDPGGVLSQGPDLVFMALVASAILRDVGRRQVVSLDMLYGAGCFYLFLGLCWGKAYAIVERLTPGSFALGAGPMAGATSSAPFPLGKDSLLMYLSFITLTTTGYGDVTPLSAMARTLAVLEAIVGQLFLTITLARLVGLYTATANLPPRDRGNSNIP